MSIDTVRAVMMKSVRAPHSLVGEHIEVLVTSKEVDHFDFDLGLSMCEGTKLFIVASDGLICISLTEFGLVSTWMIDLFDFIVGVGALIVFAPLGWTEFVAVEVGVGPPSIHVIMEINTSLAFMGI